MSLVTSSIKTTQTKFINMYRIAVHAIVRASSDFESLVTFN
jgi:hypothetical protein